MFSTWKQAVHRAGQLANIRYRRPLRGPESNNDRFVTYLADAGMCNRLKAHLVAQSYANRTGRQLLVRWSQNRQCAASFQDLFHWGECQYGRYWDVEIIQFPGIKSSLAPSVAPTCDKPLVIFDVRWQWITANQLPEYLGDHLDLARQWLQPNPKFSEHVDEVASQWPRPTVGVHMRRGDFKDLEGWTFGTDRYIEAMHRAREKFGGHVHFLLASDGSDEEARPIEQEFGSSLTRLLPSSRQSIGGIQEALNTLLLLSKTDHLLLTPRSSFGEMAAFLGGQSWQNVQS